MFLTKYVQDTFLLNPIKGYLYLKFSWPDIAKLPSEETVPFYTPTNYVSRASFPHTFINSEYVIKQIIHYSLKCFKFSVICLPPFSSFLFFQLSGPFQFSSCLLCRDCPVLFSYTILWILFPHFSNHLTFPVHKFPLQFLGCST